LPEGIQDDLADCPACLPRQRACKLRGFGIADMYLILHVSLPPYDDAERWYICTSAPNPPATWRSVVPELKISEAGSVQFPMIAHAAAIGWTAIPNRLLYRKGTGRCSRQLHRYLVSSDDPVPCFILSLRQDGNFI
jgi:hypothetical protein